LTNNMQLVEKPVQKLAVVLFNLGGPSDLAAVKPFLFNLFNDPAIIGLPNPFRWLIAKLISARRADTAAEIYKKMGGKSPILEQTEAQARALEKALSKAFNVKCFIAMRYWHPMTEAAVNAVKEWQPDQIVLLPLYPQFSTTTTGSSVKLWREEAIKAGITAPTKTICCYADQHDFIAAHVDLLVKAMKKLRGKRIRILFSAHGLPKKIIEKGDPYQAQVEVTVDAVVMELRKRIPQGSGPDHVVCYQSRVGPLEWIGPSTDAEVKRAGGDAKSIIMVPIAFVSEHSETLVELDEDYRHLAEQSGAVDYERLPALGVKAEFIEALAHLVKDALEGKSVLGNVCKKLGRICPSKDF
jgi:ferrochelatase